MADNQKVVTIMSPTSFISEIMLVLMGLSGISVIGVHMGYFYSLSFAFIGFGFSFGLFSTILCVIGIYVLLYGNYHHLKLFITFLVIFLTFQIVSIVYLYYFTNNMNTTNQEQGSIISLDVCFGLSGSTLVALVLHLKQKGSTIEMVKL